MCASTAGGGRLPEGSLFKFLKGHNFTTFENSPPLKKLSEATILSLVTRGCNLLQVQSLLELAREYKCEWSSAQHIVYTEEFGWTEMLQYRPGIIAAAILKAQLRTKEPLNPSFQHAAADALDWTIPKVFGFQLGIDFHLIESPSGLTNDEYLNGMALGYLFHESKIWNQTQGE